MTNPITGSVTGSSGSTTGNAATATTLQTPRNINGVSFNGSADITVTAAAGTLSGATLASGVTASSLTSVGTLSALTVTGAATAGKLVPTANTVTGNGMYLPAANTLAFSTNGAEGMRLDASGNLGVGVTPSAWSTTFGSYHAVEVGALGNALWSAGASDFGVTSNAFFDGAWKYANTADASRYQQADGSHRWFSAPSGTAGNALTFTERARITAGGVFVAKSNVSSEGRFQGNTTAITLANDASTTFDTAFGALFIIALGGGDSAHFYCPYGAATSLIRSDTAAGIAFYATDANTGMRVFKSNNSTTTTVKNSTGGSISFYVGIFSGL